MFSFSKRQRVPGEESLPRNGQVPAEHLNFRDMQVFTKQGPSVGEDFKEKPSL